MFFAIVSTLNVNSCICLSSSVLFLLFVQKEYASSTPYKITDGAINLVFCTHNIISTIAITIKYIFVFVNIDSKFFLLSDINPPF